MKPPQTWEEARKLLESSELDKALQIRLVQLAFNKDDSVAVKAIEMLIDLPHPEIEEELSDFTTDQLSNAERLADDWIARYRNRYPSGGGDPLSE